MNKRNLFSNIYQTVCLIMTMLFALLPVFAVFVPKEYGKYFIAFSKIELITLGACFLGYLIYCTVKCFKTSFSEVYKSFSNSIIDILKHNKHIILLLVMYIFVCISAFAAPNRERAMTGTEFRPDGLLMYSCFMAVFIFAFSLKNTFFKNCVLGVYIFSFIIVSLIMLQQYYGILGSANAKYCPEWAYDLRAWYEKHNVRYMFWRGETGSFYNLNHMGYYITICSCLFIGMFFKANKIWKKIPLGFLCAYSYWVLIVNNTFGAFLAVVLTLIITTALVIVKLRGNLLNAMIPFLVFVVVSALVTAFPLKPGESIIFRNFSKTTSDIDKVVSSSDGADRAGSGRWELWEAAFDMALEKPILGYGPDNVKPGYVKRGVDMDRAHCEPLEIAVSSGIPSAICYVAALLGIVYVNIFRRKSKIVNGKFNILAPTMSVLGYFISAMVGVFLFYTACHMFIMLGLASGSCEECIVENEEDIEEGNEVSISEESILSEN
ncbi:MAG: O-antigen ligase family protein [Clostridia bacterium]|nr:O-antigen ligase family protein [Clostridia bacterium]